MPKPVVRGMSVFLTIWLGQLVSQLGSGLTTFALGVWVYLETGSVTRFAIMFLAGTLPATLMSPLAGAIVDRYSRRLVLLICESGLAVTTLILIWLYSTQHLQIWHMYAAVLFASLFNAFHWPAYSTLVPLLVSSKNIGRANGMIQGAEALAQLASPVIAGILVATIKIKGVLIIDCVSFLFALVTLIIVRIPRISAAASQESPKSSLWRGSADGWQYIVKRRGLIGLMLFFAFSNFLAGVVEVLAQPLILSFASPARLGEALSIGGGGMLIGSIAMSVWGGPKRRVLGIFAFHFLASVAFICMGLRPSLVLVTAAAFVIFLCMPIINGSNRALMNTKVDTAVQGRVFAMSRMITSVTLPLGYLIAGPLADKIFNPLLAVSGSLSTSIGSIIGVGPGRGIGLLFIAIGALAVVVTIVGYLYKPIRVLESVLPDVVPFESSNSGEPPIFSTAPEPLQASVSAN